MQTNQNWTDVRFEISQFPRFDQCTATAIENKRKAREELAEQVNLYLANGGTITVCPPMTLTSDDEVLELRAAIRRDAVERNVREAA